MSTHYDLIVLLLWVIDAATTTHGYHGSEHDGEATGVVQFNVVCASAIDSSKYFAWDWDLTH